jgi:hypothetical protein
MEKLDALADLVIEVDGEGPPTPEQQKEAKQEEELEVGAQSWGMIAFTIGGGLAMMCPELKQVYTEDACMQWGRSMMPVAQKYGWNSPGALPELGLAMCTLSLAVPSVLAVREKLRQAKEAKKLEEAAAKTGTVVDADGK